MQQSSKKLASSLTALRELQIGGRRVFRSNELSRVHRERLLAAGFVQEAARVWLISSSPSARPGDSTPWYASFWEFCACYCEDRFGTTWYLSPEQSMLVHSENTVIPSQAVISSTKGTNNKIELPFGTSLYDLKAPHLPLASDLTRRDGLRLFVPEAALVRVSATYFAMQPIETRVVLNSIRESSELLRRLLEGGHSVVAGRLAGALRRVGRPALADEIVITMRSAGYVVRETDPFAPKDPVSALPSAEPPIVGRMRALWESMREPVLEIFPNPPGRPRNKKVYLRMVEEVYQRDAYHSLSIEGYTVTPELIERVRAGNWNPEQFDTDRQSRDALAARGYWQAFQAVKADVAEIITGRNAGALLRKTHRDWYRELFQPCVVSGLIPPGAFAGYRNDAVYLRTSRYVPPRWEAVRDAMPALFELLANEPQPGVRAVLGHWLLGYIHPYPDGNGRMARFLMNAMLASGGYPWTVIEVGDRVAYLSALDSASIQHDIRPFARFLAERVKGAMDAS